MDSLVVASTHIYYVVHKKSAPHGVGRHKFDAFPQCYGLRKKKTCAHIRWWHRHQSNSYYRSVALLIRRVNLFRNLIGACHIYQFPNVID